jgi:hypothetical protein
MSRIRRLLTIYTSLGVEANYTLQATVPPHLLSRCSSALPRPQWEPVLYYSMVCFMGFLLVFVCLAAYCEGDRIIVADVIRRKRLQAVSNTPIYDKSKVFDLRSVTGFKQLPQQAGAGHHHHNSVANHSGHGPGSTLSGGELRAAMATTLMAANGHVEYSHSAGRQPFMARVLSAVRCLNPRRLLFTSPSTKTPKAGAGPQKAGEGAGSGGPGETHRPLARTDSTSSGKGGAERRASNSAHPNEASAGLDASNGTDKANGNHINNSKTAARKSKANKRHLPDTTTTTPVHKEAVDYHRLAVGGSPPPSASKKASPSSTTTADPEDDPRERSTASEAADDLDDIKLDSTSASKWDSFSQCLLYCVEMCF